MEGFLKRGAEGARESEIDSAIVGERVGEGTGSKEKDECANEVCRLGLYAIAGLCINGGDLTLKPTASIFGKAGRGGGWSKAVMS